MCLDVGRFGHVPDLCQGDGPVLISRVWFSSGGCKRDGEDVGREGFMYLRVDPGVALIQIHPPELVGIEREAAFIQIGNCSLSLCSSYEEKSELILILPRKV